MLESLVDHGRRVGCDQRHAQKLELLPGALCWVSQSLRSSAAAFSKLFPMASRTTFPSGTSSKARYIGETRLRIPRDNDFFHLAPYLSALPCSYAGRADWTRRSFKSETKPVDACQREAIADESDRFRLSALTREITASNDGATPPQRELLESCLVVDL